MIRLATLFASVSVIAFSVPAFAQGNVSKSASAAADEGDAAEIIVTALKRNSNVQETAATVQAISGQDVKAAQVVDLTDVGRLVPSMQIYTSPLGNPALFLYGMGTGGAGTTFEQSVMPFFNGVANGHARSMLIGTYDLASIEVVKGTQAILGKNASLGAVLINTQKPVDQLGASVTGRYEFKLKSTYGEGMINAPLSDDLRVRVAGQYRDDPGFNYNATLSRKEPAIKSYSGRASVEWLPTSNLTLDLVYQYDHRKGEGMSYIPVAFTANAVVPTTPGRTGFTGTGPFGPSGDSYTGHRFSGTATLDLDGVIVTAITGYQKYDALNSIDADLLAAPTFAVSFEERNRLISQEIRVASDESNKFRWLVGGYVSRDRFVTPIQARTAVGSTNFAFDQTSKSISGFAQANYELLDGLDISGGVRVTSAQKEARTANTLITAGAYSTISQPPFPETLVKRDVTNFDYSVGAKYKVNANLMLYASYGKGTKSGGFNNQAKPAPTYAEFLSNAQFGEEVAHTLEAGVKYSLPGIGHLNLSGFHVRVDNFQSAFATGQLLLYRSLNQRSDGFTFDALLRPINGLSLSATVT